MKNQCFGGDYMGEVFDHMLKRMSYRRQKRWWNAYILFYRRVDMEVNITRSLNELSLSDNKQSQSIKMPVAIERSVRRQNIRFMHNRNQFSVEYFQFMKKLIMCNGPYVTIPGGHDKLSADAEELALISIQLAAKFLFTTGFHAKKTLRGPANDWYDALCIHLRNSCNVRRWFANQLFANPHAFCEYLLECPGSEVRSAFMRILVFIAHFALQDGPYTPPALENLPFTGDSNSTLAHNLIVAVLSLLRKEVSEHGRHLTQYFSLFAMFASLGVAERTMLLQLNVPATFMKVALDEGPGPPIKYQYAELGKLYQVVSLLIRSCDVSSKTQSSHGGTPLPNPFVGDNVCQEYIMPIQSEVADILYNNTCYLKKIVEDANNSEDTLRLLKFCSWENPHFSSMVLNELLWQISYSYTYELRPYLDFLLHMMLLEDSWQNHRIHNALKGIPDDREGLFDTIARSKNHHQKRSYQCIKVMVALFATCPAAAQMLQSNGDLKRKWTNAVEWLNDELERRPYPTNAQYGYNNWSPPAQSNETTNGYFLERSHTARITLAKAFELCPDEDIEDQDMSEDGESPPPEEKVQSWQGNSQSIPQHPSPPPPAPSDGVDPSPKAPILPSSEPIEEPLEPPFLSSNNESSSDTQHTSDSTSSSVTTTVSPTTVVLGDETTSTAGEERREPSIKKTREEESLTISVVLQRPYPTNAQYGYNNWSPPAQSNETSNGQFLERSHSARITLAKAFELCPDEDIEDQEGSEDEDEMIPPDGKSCQENDPIPLHDIQAPVTFYPKHISESSQLETGQSAPPDFTEPIFVSKACNWHNRDKRTDSVSIDFCSPSYSSAERRAEMEMENEDPYTASLYSELGRLVRERNRKKNKQESKDETSSSTDQSSQMSSDFQKHCNQNSI
ncbi:probable ubiquitin carboxyl-terminal hydrolase FAF-X [Trichonephila clavata]|uniref:Probable ubiquitin carboxyl-terminal hydrolase FAF-X n=1 Tax=Trichonephila clavata TaxID=2740835 RepID=A0A8X6JHC9_TRICU|nr:probable ubiquitin carboxyl-terminal hydrolase FAF-X [Trichonephila clavata]